MKKFDKKIVSTTFALVLGAFATFSSAAQIQGFVSGYAPGKVDVAENAKGVKSSYKLDTDLMWSLGGEFLVSPVGPLMVGGGLGFFSVQTNGENNVVMPSVPLWGSVGVIGPEQWTVRPYFEARVGYPIAVSRFKTWWNKPLNFFAGANVGVQLPYHMGVEFNCTYLTMDKYFKITDVEYRLSSVKFGGSITVHFDLFKGASEPSKAPVAIENVAAEPAAQESSDIYSSDVSESSEQSSYEDPYSSYGDTSADQSAEQPAEESAAEPVSEEPAAETSSDVESSVEPAAEETAESSESSADEGESSEVEASAEEAPAEEAVAEAPAEEPVAEPAPAPAAKPAAKKAPAKKKATKKAAKKTTKKAKAKAKPKAKKKK